MTEQLREIMQMQTTGKEDAAHDRGYREEQS